MKKIQKFSSHLRDRIFRHLEAARRNYEKTMINNMDNLHRVIRKGDIILGNCNEFQVICSGMIAKAFQRVGYPIIPALVLQLVPVAGICIDLFFRGQHLVLGGDQYQLTLCGLSKSCSLVGDGNPHRA